MAEGYEYKRRSSARMLAARIAAILTLPFCTCTAVPLTETCKVQHAALNQSPLGHVANRVHDRRTHASHLAQVAGTGGKSHVPLGFGNLWQLEITSTVCQTAEERPTSLSPFQGPAWRRANMNRLLGALKMLVDRP